jgi:putative peptide zinc metalloprotease protein
MTATAQPPARPVETLDRAQGIELLGDVHGSGYENGAALVRRADGQIVQVGPLMYALLECVDGRRSHDELAALLCEQLGRDCDAEHVAALAEKLAAQGLLAGTEENAPPRRNPLLALRWKVLVTDPNVTNRLTRPFMFLFHPVVLWPLVAAFVVSTGYLLFVKGVASATSDAFQSPELLLLVFALAILSAGFHELGHAAACRYGGATPGGMGAGIYMVWPAFYTDVTDAYRLPRADRLRVDLGGIYFNAVVCVVTFAGWLAWRADALLLLIALQLLMMVKNLSPVIRSDGYHILADATGVPDLYAHILPTLRRLLPWRKREPSALRGRARALVTVWVLVVVPVLLSLMLGAVLLLPRLLASAWDSGRTIVEGIPHQGVLGVLASLVRLLALLLPVLGSVLVAQMLARMLIGRARSWSQGRPLREAFVVGLGTAAACGAAWALWPAGQYQPVRAGENGTLIGLGALVTQPATAARPHPAPAVRLTPGTHLAIAMIPQGGATKQHPAVFVIPGDGDDPAVAIVSDVSPDPADPASTLPATTTTAVTTQTTATTTTTSSDSPAPVAAKAFPFKLPSAPGPGGTQALAVNTTDGGVKYDVAYTLVTVSDGKPVTNTNAAYALASCKACTTVAVSFQVVLIVGTSKNIAPINAAVAGNADCPACMTTAIADQIVVTLKDKPTGELLQQLQDALKQLDAVSALGANGTPAAVAAAVTKVQQQIDQELQASGQLANPTTTATSTKATTTSPTTTATTTTQKTTTTTAQTTTAKTTTTSSTATTTTAQTTTATEPTTTTAPTTTTTPETTTTTSG